jgi:OOP family OmpA-OmpF porin
VGIPASRLVTAGVGESQPVASNETPAGQARNRRVEITAL